VAEITKCYEQFPKTRLKVRQSYCTKRNSCIIVIREMTSETVHYSQRLKIQNETVPSKETHYPITLPTIQPEST
jgi:hypothetical protein